MADAAAGPLAGLRVLDYGQYVAGPFATMLLADLGADVVKVEPPAGDAWRRYEPFAPGESRYFYALNRNKRSVVLDLKTEGGRARSAELIRRADAIVHNMPPERAARFGLDRESVRSLNPRAVWCCVSAFGSVGPETTRTAYDLIAQALSGLLMADARPGDVVPRRSGGVARADFTAGLLAAMGVLAGLVGRDAGGASGIEVSLLGAALAVQAQQFVSLDAIDAPASIARGPLVATPDDLTAHAEAIARDDELEPYYRCYAGSDGFFALACLNADQRRRVLDLLGLDDPWVENPQAEPADERERAVRAALSDRLAAAFESRPAAEWIEAFQERGVPAGEVRLLEQLYDSEQVQANGLVQTVRQPGVGDVRLLGNVFKVDGHSAPAQRHAPALGEHTAQVLAEAATSGRKAR